MDRTLIAWNLPNWITVLLMAAAGWALLGVVSQWLIKPGTSAGGGQY